MLITTSYTVKFKVQIIATKSREYTRNETTTIIHVSAYTNVQIPPPILSTR